MVTNEEKSSADKSKEEKIKDTVTKKDENKTTKEININPPGSIKSNPLDDELNKQIKDQVKTGAFQDPMGAEYTGEYNREDDQYFTDDKNEIDDLTLKMEEEREEKEERDKSTTPKEERDKTNDDTEYLTNNLDTQYIKETTTGDSDDENFLKREEYEDSEDLRRAGDADYRHVQQNSTNENNPHESSYAPDESGETTYMRSEFGDVDTRKAQDEAPMYTLFDSFIDFISLKRVIFSTISIILGISSIFLMDHKVRVLTLKDKPVDFSAGLILLTFSMALIVSIGVGIGIEKLTFRLLKNAESNTGSITFYAHGCAYHIGLTFSLVSLSLFVFFLIRDFYVPNPYFNNLKTQVVILVTVAYVVILAMEKCMTLKATFSFNYATYLKRIKRAIFMDLFVTVLSLIRDFKTPEDDLIGDDEDWVDDSPVFIARKQKRNRPKQLLTYIFDKEFSHHNTKPMTFGTKYLLLSEFKELCRYYKKMDNLSILVVLTKIRERAHYKTAYLFKSLQQQRMFRLSDLRYIFKDPLKYKQMISALGLKKTDEISKEFLELFLEKSLKEKYLISYSLRQLHAAIDRIHFSIQIITTLIYMLCIAVAGMGMLTSFGGIASTIFGIPIIASILKDHLVNPIMFLFVIHPYDVGDRIEIELNGKMENLVVSELNVFSTHFFRWDGTSFFVPNSTLSTLPICNIRRSGPFMENHIIQVAATTDILKIQEFKKRLQWFVKRYPYYYTDYILVNYEKIDDSNKLHIKVLMQYKTNLQNFEQYLALKSNFICFMNRTITVLGINYELPVQTIKLHEQAEEEIEATAPYTDKIDELERLEG